jgi:hypothetical protein
MLRSKAFLSSPRIFSLDNEKTAGPPSKRSTPRLSSVWPIVLDD